MAYDSAFVSDLIFHQLRLAIPRFALIRGMQDYIMYGKLMESYEKDIYLENVVPGYLVLLTTSSPDMLWWRLDLLQFYVAQKTQSH